MCLKKYMYYLACKNYIYVSNAKRTFLFSWTSRWTILSQGFPSSLICFVLRLKLRNISASQIPLLGESKCKSATFAKSARFGSRFDMELKKVQQRGPTILFRVFQINFFFVPFVFHLRDRFRKRHMIEREPFFCFPTLCQKGSPGKKKKLDKKDDDSSFLSSHCFLSFSALLRSAIFSFFFSQHELVFLLIYAIFMWSLNKNMVTRLFTYF